LRLFRRFWALLARLFVHCVLACTSPVAVRVAVNPSEQTPIADLLITSDNRGDAGVCTGCKSPVSNGSLFSGLSRVAPHCVPGGVRRPSITRAGSIESRWRAGPRKGSQLNRPPEHGNLESWRIPPSLGNNPPLSRSGSSRHRAQSNLRKLRSAGMGRALHAGVRQCRLPPRTSRSCRKGG
jgi:hypothetical protein